MHKLVIALFIVALLVEHVAVKYGGSPGRFLTLLPELFSVILIVVLLVRLAIVRTVSLPAKYGIFFAIFFLHMLVGVLVNAVEPGVLVAGFRNYLKYLPFFLLPAMYAYSDQQMRRQLYWLMGFAFLQFPFSVWQRLETIRARAMTGDWVVGTLNTHSTKMLFLVCIMSVLVAFVIKGRLRPGVAAITIIVLLIPIAISETKATIFFLPLALLVPVVFYHAKDWAARVKKRKQLVTVTVVGALALAIFVPIYDHYQKPRWGYGLVDFFLMENRVAGYLAPSTSGLRPERVGRIDGVVSANEILSEEPVRWMVGLGMGNISPSFIPRFSGEYVHYQELIGGGALAPYLFELGFVGVGLLLFFYFMVFRDAMRLSRQDSLAGAVALGWLGVIVILAVALAYNSYTMRNVNYLFWYFSGYVAASLYRAQVAARAASAQPMPTAHVTPAPALSGAGALSPNGQSRAPRRPRGRTPGPGPIGPTRPLRPQG
ncbi:hypothetical protein HUS23_08240 [Ectothiorhodospiraceae bacterium 2226]|nr:hypothetical protein HUS23_08240 [Ectothiorhodospiraceae bacterium 2226]